MTPTLTMLVAALVGAAPFAIAYLGKKANTQFPALAEVKRAYPVITTVLNLASQSTDDHTVPGLVADAAYLFWTSQGRITVERAKELTAASVYYFDNSKYLATNFGALNPAAIAKGEEIASQLFQSKA